MNTDTTTTRSSSIKTYAIAGVGCKSVNPLPRAAVAAAVSFALGLLSVASNDLQAGTITVTSTADDGTGSLRAALAAAADGDAIDFSLPAPAAITLTTGELLITKDLTISGPGPANLSISGNSNSRVFNIATGGTVRLSGLAIRNGRANAADNGGGIYNVGTLTLNNCDVSFNAAGDGTTTLPGGNGGGIFNSGSLTVAGCTFRSNRGGTGIAGSNGSPFGAPPGGGGGGGSGAGISNSGSLTVGSSTFSDNEAGKGGQGGSTSGLVAASGGPGGAGGGIFSTSSLTCVSCTFKGNHAGTGGGGGSSFGLQGEAGAGGNGGTGGGIANSGTATVRNSIIAQNDFGVGGPGGYSSTAAGPNGPRGPNGFRGSAPDGSGTFNSEGRNLIGANDGSTGFTNAVNGNIVGTANSPINPLLGGLQDNGGPTWTMSLVRGSPAIDAGDDSLTGTDQRGLPRPSGAHVDIGAYEGVSEPGEALLVGLGGNNSVAGIEVRSGAAFGTFVQPADGASYQTFGPRGMLCVNNQLLVVNQNVDTPFNGEILKFDLRTGAFLGKLVPSFNPNAPYAPRGMIAGPNGVIYVADFGGFESAHPGRIARYTSQGVFIGNVVTTGLSVPFYPMGLVTGPDGLLYVSGVGNLAQGNINGFIFRFKFNAGTQNYRYLDTIVSSTVGNSYAPGLHSPEGIVFGPDGNIYITSFLSTFSTNQGSVTHRDAILVFATSGQRLGSPIYLYGTGEPRVFAQTMLFGPRGDLFVPITSHSGVRRYSATDDFQQFTVLPSDGASLGQPWYLTFRATNPTTLAYQPPQITAILNGDRFDVSWPADYVGWQLQVQTNGLSRDNWVDVPDSISTNSFSLLMNPSDTTAFFRLVAP